jgi:hypothetical protein
VGPLLPRGVLPLRCHHGLPLDLILGHAPDINAKVGGGNANISFTLFLFRVRGCCLLVLKLIKVDCYFDLTILLLLTVI